MSSFTCITCHVLFTGPEIQRNHYKSDWHRYNLKRKIAELPPITDEVFQMKVSLLKESEKEANEASYCDVCRKYFGSKNAFDNHLNSKKHRHSAFSENGSAMKAETKCHAVPTKANENSQVIADTGTLNVTEQADDIEEEDGDDSDWESCDEDDTVLEINTCIFCSYESLDLESNIQHMTGFHSFFIPDIEYVADLPGLVSYLHGKVTVGCICIWCRKEFHSAKSTQQHIVDMGHCKIFHEEKYLTEYISFYDYTSSYPTDVRNVDNTDEVTRNELSNENWELTLPSGARVGHRSLAIYYRQNLPPVKLENSKRLIHKVMSHYRGLGWNGTTVNALQKAKHITYMRKQQAKHSLKLGVHNNKMQHHFRQQVMF